MNIIKSVHVIEDSEYRCLNERGYSMYVAYSIQSQLSTKLSVIFWSAKLMCKATKEKRHTP